MKPILLLCLLTFPAFGAETAVAPAQAPTSIVFAKTNSLGYGSGNTVRQATLTGPAAGVKVVVDEVSYKNSQGPKKYYNCQLFQDGKVVAQNRLMDPFASGLNADSGLRMVHYKAHLYGNNNSQEERVEDRQFPVAYLFFQRPNALCPILAVVLASGGGYYGTKELYCDHYTLAPGADSPNDLLTVYSRTGFPTAWSFEDSVRQNEKSLETHPQIHQPDLDPGTYDVYQKKLEEELKAGRLDAMARYQAHMELSGLYQKKSRQNPSTLDGMGKKAEKEIREAVALQPQFPLKNLGAGTPGLPAFTFEKMVETPLEANGEYGYQAYKMGTSGKAALVPGPLKDWDQVNDELNQTHHENDPAPSPNPSYVSTVSPTGFFRISISTEQGAMGITLSYPALVVDDINQGEETEVPVPDTGNVESVGWNPQKDLYYFLVSTGRDNAHNLWQYSPAQKTLMKIGYASKKVYMNRDGKWLIWGNGGGEYSQSTTGFNAFNVAKGVSYRLTHSFEPKFFVGWN